MTDHTPGVWEAVVVHAPAAGPSWAFPVVVGLVLLATFLLARLSLRP